MNYTPILFQIHFLLNHWFESLVLRYTVFFRKKDTDTYNFFGPKYALGHIFGVRLILQKDAKNTIAVIMGGSLVSEKVGVPVKTTTGL